MSASGADDRLLDRDQIWIVKKDPNTGESTLNWLMDWSPNSKENYGKNYRHGVYGGLAQPNLYATVPGTGGNQSQGASGSSSTVVALSQKWNTSNMSDGICSETM